MSHHSPHQIEDAFAVEGYRLVVRPVGNLTQIDYYDDAEDWHAARITIRLRSDGGVEACRFWVDPKHQGRGIFTNAHKWALEQPSSLIKTNEATGQAAEFYKQSGYVEVEPGVLELDTKKTKKWLKGR
jgi:GNAT superfamily N-acetyltransferase